MTSFVKSYRPVWWLILILAIRAAPGQSFSSAYRVLGQPDLRSSGINMLGATGLNTPMGIAVDVRNGEVRLYISDTENSRVLAWRDIRSYQIGDPPALVLGQPGPQYSSPLGIGTKGLAEPLGLAIAPATGDLYIADYSNHRVLRFPSPFDNPTRVDPDAVYGQPNFSSRTATAASANSLNHPRALAFDSDGNLWVADSGNNRVLRFAASSLNNVTPPPADVVIGQKDFHNSSANAGGSISANGLDTPAGICVDAQKNLYVSDYRNARVLKFSADVSSGLAFPAATMVWGQSNMTAHILPQTSASTIGGPLGLSVDAARNLYVAVAGENRVLVLPADGPSAAPARSALGQSDLSTATANTGVAPLASASSLATPTDIAVDDAGGVVIADAGNHRVVQIPSGSRSASRVWGQNSFTANGLNRVKPGSLYLPYKIAIDYSAQPFALYVSDTGNNRVLVWKDSVRFRNGDPADLAIGQPDLFTGLPNSDGQLLQKATALSLSSPTGIAVDPGDGTLYVADTGNNRVLRYPRPVSQSGRIAPAAVLGQPDFASSSSAIATASTLSRPVAVAVAPGGALFVSDTGNNRVLQFVRGAATGAAAVRVFGQLTMNSGQKSVQSTAQTLTAPQGLSIDAGGNLYVADAGAARVLVFPNTDSAPVAGAIAAAVIGQTTFTASGTARFKTPTDVAVDANGNIFVADPAYNRVLIFQSLVFIPSSGAAPVGVVGQNTAAGTAPNWDSADGLGTPNSLNSPLGVSVDRQNTLYVADAGNNRALHFLKPVATVNAAAMQSGAAVARGSLASLFTRGLLDDPGGSAVDSTWPRALLNREIVINSDMVAPIYFLNSGQVNFQVPAAAAIAAQQIAVRASDTGELIAGGDLLVGSAAPGLFTASQSGVGQAAALNEDLSVNGPSNPAAAGSTIVLYGTGQGQVSPAVADGVPAPFSPLSNTVAVPTADGRACLTSQPSMCVAIGSAFGVVRFSGLAPGFVGLWQINVAIPPNTPPGAVPVRVIINGAASNTVTVAIRQ